jgi:alpha-galactosidase
MVAVREMVRVSAKSTFNNGGNEGARNDSLKLRLDFWINGQIYPNGKESLISSIFNRGK